MNVTTGGAERSVYPSRDCLLAPCSQIISAGDAAETRVATREDCIARHAVHDSSHRSRRNDVVAAPNEHVRRLLLATAGERRRQQQRTRQDEKSSTTSLECHG